MKKLLFFAISAIGCFCVAVSVTFGQADGEAVPAGDWHDPKLENVEITVPPFKGEYYEAEIPDTLELTDRAALCINGMTRLLNPEYDYAQYTYVGWRHDPPYLAMEAGITNLNPKWLEALPLMRIMSGNSVNADIDHHIIEGILHNTGFDGLTYQPPNHPGAFYDESTKEQNLPWANPAGEGRQLIWLAIMHQVTADPIYRELGDRKIDRLLEIAATKEDALYFRRGHGYTPGQKDADKAPIFAITDHEVMDPSLGVVGTPSARTEGTVALGVARYYLVTGYPPALELARGTAKYLKDHARVIDDSGRWHGWHFHVLARALIGAAEVGILTDDDEMLRWVQRAYEYGKSIGEPVLGFFAGVPACDPCQYNPNAKECGMDKTRLETEPCSISDMAIVALKLTHAGLADYYEDVEYYVRNLMVETQITSADFLQVYPKELSHSDAIKNQHNHHREVLGPLNYDNVAERALGSFCNSRPNQWYLGVAGPNSCGCCLGNVARAYYYIWDSILQAEGQDLRVNLLLNRASPEADLESYLPYEGKVVLKMKQAKNVFTRIPGWTQRAKVSCTVNGEKRNYQWQGNYIAIGPLNTGDEAVVRFPIMEKLMYRSLKGHEFWVTVRGFTVVDVEPHVEVTPIFQREKYRRPKAPMRNVKRFVSSQRIDW